MIIKNVRVYTKNNIFEEGVLATRDGKLVCLADADTEQEIDGEGAYAIPGLVDMHLHGCAGYDFCDGTKEAIAKIAEYELQAGVVAFAPATMALPVEELERILHVAAEYADEQKFQMNKNSEADRQLQSPDRGGVEGQGFSLGSKCADLVGINMEAPFISQAKKGAQDASYILPCEVTYAKRFIRAAGGLVKVIGIAPEASENALEFVEQMKGEVNLALAHTNADYDTAKAAFDAGVNHVVHLHNAMPAFLSREPGVVGAALDSDNVSAELICDGVHLHPAMVRATFRMFKEERIILISDSMRATGMPDGIYTLGGQDVKVEGKYATLLSNGALAGSVTNYDEIKRKYSGNTSNGALAGSVTNLMDVMRTAVKMGIPLETAVACASSNPAKYLGIDDCYGSLEIGKNANILLLDDNLNLKMVVKDGNQL